MIDQTMIRYKYLQINAFVDSLNANIDNTIIAIITIFCFTIIVISIFQYHPLLAIMYVHVIQ